MSVPAENMPPGNKKKLPKDIQDSIDVANEIETVLRRGPEEEISADEQNDSNGAAPDAGAAATEAPAAAPVEVAEGKTQAPGRPNGEAQEQEPPAPVEPDNADYRQRWLSLNGMLSSKDREIARLQAELEAATAARNERARAVDQGSLEGVTEQDIEDYGSDMVEAMKRAAMDAVRDELDGLKARNRELEQRLAGQNAQTKQSAHEAFLRDMDRDFPLWRKLNNDQPFLDWLEEPDLLSGQQRHALLSSAVGDRNTARAIAIFKTYLSEKEAVAGIVDPAPVQPSLDAPSEPVRPGRVPLETMATPGAGSPGGTDGTSGEGVKDWSESQIAAFYNEATKTGLARRHPDRYRAVEQEIQAAIRAGKVRRG